ncbi:hypothetical protein FA09DRAFT_329804 [Tilletiopsis washingtonensis]|uniref:Uncharacterized protein n=1 Tax=Tilletiopsis washingtonensis TaxID=58919 RepID=A0A316ZB82_9BASI|nr:hypothetical protein FA09DRAFT_329804 [Tilletiopsis washingtonensis]PWN98182.1 hypothetical protein FA09DRAFT_329804 [Tilletiopsis washingtonensis]
MEERLCTSLPIQYRLRAAVSSMPAHARTFVRRPTHGSHASQHRVCEPDAQKLRAPLLTPAFAVVAAAAATCLPCPLRALS